MILLDLTFIPWICFSSKSKLLVDQSIPNFLFKYRAERALHFVINVIGQLILSLMSFKQVLSDGELACSVEERILLMLSFAYCDQIWSSQGDSRSFCLVDNLKYFLFSVTLECYSYGAIDDSKKVLRTPGLAQCDHIKKQ